MMRRYRDRLDRLRARARFLRERLAKNETRESRHDLAEISALEWAVAQLAPWFDEALPPNPPCSHCGFVTPELVKDRALRAGRER
jgi:hypothetical protein